MSRVDKGLLLAKRANTMKRLRLITVKRILIFAVIGAIGCIVTELVTKIDPNVASYIWVIGFFVTFKVADNVSIKATAGKGSKR